MKKFVLFVIILTASVLFAQPPEAAFSLTPAQKSPVDVVAYDNTGGVMPIPGGISCSTGNSAIVTTVIDTTDSNRCWVIAQAEGETIITVSAGTLHNDLKFRVARQIASISVTVGTAVSK
jgi:hypothetical protein